MTPLPNYLLTSDPFRYLWQCSLVQSGHSTHPGPLWNKSKPCSPHTAHPFSVGPHNPHSHPRTMSGWVTITSKRPFFHAIPRHFSTFWWTPGVFPSGLRGLGPKGGLGVLGYPHPYTDSLPGHPSTQLLDQYHNALPLCHPRYHTCS